MYKTKSPGGMIAREAFLMLLLAGATAAQTAIYGSSTTAPTKIYGDPTLTTVLNAASTFTKIYVVFPPQSSSVTNTHFVSYVMTQSSIDGVTLQVPWNVVETSTSPPSMTDCTTFAPPANNPDVCQPDPKATGWFHTYDWSAIDGTGCSDYSQNSSSQWFCSFGGVYKQVNFVLVGTGGSPTNSITPTYVTGSNWIAAASPGYLHEDVVNTINASNCGGYSGTIANAPNGSTFTGDGSNPSVINVTGWSSPPFAEGDTVWVSGFAGALVNLNVAGQYGSTVHLGNTSPCSTAAGVNFCYTGSGVISLPGSGGLSIHLIKAVDSWPVPYEDAYAGAWGAFLTAAIYHFNHHANVSQIAYIRPGVARGGEAIPLCTTTGPLGGGGGAFPGTSPGYSKSTWETWYTTVNSAIQTAQPRMQIMYSINAGDSQHQNASYATDEAGIAISYSGATGLYNGFGSQGLQIGDDTSFGTCPGGMGAPTTSNNWGCMFTQYWSGGSTPTTVPLELQQIDCSNPNGYAPTGTNKCFLGVSGTGLTGDLRVVYPFAAANHASILELYHHDALLAFDPYYCVVSGTSCAITGTPSSDSFGTDLSLDAQYHFFNDATDAVGIDSTCNSGYGVPTPVGGTGKCRYADKISASHGPH